MNTQRPLRLGMVGGGQGAYIGNIHRLASRLDGKWQLVAGAFDVDPQRGREFAIGEGLDPARSHGVSIPFSGFSGNLRKLFG